MRIIHRAASEMAKVPKSMEYAMAGPMAVAKIPPSAGPRIPPMVAPADRKAEEAGINSAGRSFGMIASSEGRFNPFRPENAAAHTNNSQACGWGNMAFAIRAALPRAIDISAISTMRRRSK